MKLKSVLLIDDDHTTNVFHTVILKRAQITEQILTMETPEIALEHLEMASAKKEGASFGQMAMPELIFLDLTMPRMTGLEFLAEFKNIYDRASVKSVIYMLTASIDVRDPEVYTAFDFVKGVLSKPLSPKILEDIMTTHFNNE